MSRANRCDVCGVRTASHTGFCRTHKFAIRRACRRVKEESLIVDQAGGSWWVWDAKGEVLVIGQASRTTALAALGVGGDLGLEDDADVDGETAAS